MTASDLDILLTALNADLSEIVSFLIGGFTGLAFALASTARIVK